MHQSPPLSNVPNGHAIVAYCTACPHRHHFERDELIERYGDLRADVLKRRLRCRLCGTRGAETRLVWCGWE